MKLPASLASRTKPFFNDRIPSMSLFIFSMLFLVVFFFLKSTAVVWIITGIFFILTLLKRGKAMLLPTVILTIGITFFELLTPFGKVLITISSLRITDGALMNGLHKSGILCGMLFISQFALSPNLHIPGVPGRFLSRIFFYFDKLSEKSISLKPGTIIDSIDKRLIEIWEED